LPKSPRSLSPADLEPFCKAYAAGLESLIRRYNPGVAPRLRAWMDRLLEEFQRRQSRDGKKQSEDWLIAELRNPQLPDMRARGHLDRDQQLVRRYEDLRKAIKPKFSQFRRNLESRNQVIAPLVSQQLGRPFSPCDLLTDRSLSRFCYHVLGTNAVTLSRARKRLNRVAARHVLDGVEIFQRIAKGEDPRSAEQATLVLRELKPVLPYCRRQIRG